jgi:putative ABC transport system permease protein
MTTFINAVQEDTLSSYPLTLESQHMDISSLLVAFMDKAASDSNHEKDAVYQKAMFYNLVNSLNDMKATENDLKAFKEYLEQERKDPNSPTGLQNAINGVQYTYAIDLLIYTENIDGDIIQSDTRALLQELLIEYFGLDLSGMMQMNESMMGGSATMSMSNSGVKLWQEMLPGDNGKLINPLLEKQYDVIHGSWPNDYNEIVLVVDENNEIDDMTLYALGLMSKEDIDALANAAFHKESIDFSTKSGALKRFAVWNSAPSFRQIASRLTKRPVISPTFAKLRQDFVIFMQTVLTLRYLALSVRARMPFPRCLPELSAIPMS